MWPFFSAMAVTAKLLAALMLWDEAAAHTRIFREQQRTASTSFGNFILKAVASLRSRHIGQGSCFADAYLLVAQPLATFPVRCRNELSCPS
jgi:hypothetical protein